MNFIQTIFKSNKTASNPDYVLFLIASMLIIIGIIFSYSLSAYIVLNNGYNQFHFLIRQLIVGTVAIIIMFVMAHLEPEKIVNKIGMGLFILFLIVMMVMPFLPESLVTETGGANRWIKLPFFSVSPVEFFKIGFIYFLAWSFQRRVLDKPKETTLVNELLLTLPYFGAFLLVVFLVAFLQKDFGQVVLLGVIFCLLLVFANRSFKLFLFLGTFFVIGMVSLIIIEPHRIQRIYSWWSLNQNKILGLLPESADAFLRIKGLPEPYQVGHSLNAIHNGSYFGTGLGEASLKLGFLSEVHTDFVLAGITEETGFAGFLVVVLLMFLLIWRIFKISRRVENPVYHLFSIGIGLMIIISFLINSYGISGLIPIKGIAVPFLSYGGSSLLSLGICMGLILSISNEVFRQKGEK